MDSDMLTKPDTRPVFAHVARKFTDFLEDEDGSIAIFIAIAFVMILMLGGMAVDTMRFEMRRVALQETLDRATLAAANVVLPPSVSPQSVVTEWFNKSGLGNELTVDYFAPVVGGSATTSSREATARATVRSYNHFMSILEMPYFEGPAVSVAQQGVSKIEVMMVLDITGSMSQSSGTTTKIAALRTAASNFVTILKYSRDSSNNYTINKDPNNLISIGMVPYASNVNIPDALRDQFNVTDLSSWNYVANAGVNSPDINCLEIPESTYNTLAVSTDDPISMAPVALATNNRVTPGTNTTATTGTNNDNGRNNGGVITLNRSTPPGVPSKNTDNFVCNHGDNFSTGADESASNMLLLPTTNITTIKDQIAMLNPRGRTSIAVGMRWGTAMIDQSARDIYTAIRGGEAAMAGRPANNSDVATRKIIVLMTDGNHVASENVFAFKTGPSPIWRGADGNMVIRYTNGGPARTGGQRPGLTATTNTCSGWVIPAGREFFAPHLKDNSVQRRDRTNEPEGQGTGTSYEGACDPNAWLSSSSGTPSWSGSGTVRRLDWSEVWRYASVDWVIRQLYMRSGVDGTNNYTTVYNQFVAPYLGSASYMDDLLNTNCTAAKAAGVEVFGIVLGDNVNQVPVQNCSSPGTGYFYRVTNANNLNAAFEQIAVLISDLRLTN